MDLDFLRDCIDDVCAGLDTAEQLTDDMLDQLIDDATTENEMETMVVRNQTQTLEEVSQ